MLVLTGTIRLHFTVNLTGNPAYNRLLLKKLNSFCVMCNIILGSFLLTILYTDLVSFLLMQDAV